MSISGRFDHFSIIICMSKLFDYIPLKEQLTAIFTVTVSGVAILRTGCFFLVPVFQFAMPEFRNNCIIVVITLRTLISHDSRFCAGRFFDHNFFIRIMRMFILRNRFFLLLSTTLTGIFLKSLFLFRSFLDHFSFIIGMTELINCLSFTDQCSTGFTVGISSIAIFCTGCFYSIEYFRIMTGCFCRFRLCSTADFTFRGLRSIFRTGRFLLFCCNPIMFC